MGAKPGTVQWERDRADYWFNAYCKTVDQRDAAGRDARMWSERFFRAMRQLRKVRA